MTELQKRVVGVVRKIPKGKVMSYGQVAVAIGFPRGARQVGWILRGLGEDTKCPWWRVINNEGKITIKGNKHHGPLEQRARLIADGVEVSAQLIIDIERYRYRPKLKSPASLPNFFPS